MDKGTLRFALILAGSSHFSKRPDAKLTVVLQHLKVGLWRGGQSVYTWLIGLVALNGFIYPVIFHNPT